jgi:multiple sugar transport system permease protein
MCFTLLPLVASLVLSFFEWPLIGQPVFTGIQNYIRLANDPTFWTALGNTVVFVAGYMILNLLVSLGLALWLTTKVRGRAIFRVLFFLPVVAPVVANAVIWRLLYNPSGGIFDFLVHALTGNPGPNFLGSNTWAMPAMILMSVWQGFGYNMMIFIAGIEAIPAPIKEAALLDGAGRWRGLTNIVLPLISPSIFFASVLTLLTSFQVFAQPYVLTGGGPGEATTTLVLYLYQAGFRDFQSGYASAIAWVLFIIIMIFTLIQFRLQRRLVSYD